MTAMRPLILLFAITAALLASPAFRKAVGASSELAREMLAAGRGEEKDSFDDLNQGKLRSIRMTARIYCSYFDPEGMAAMSLNAARIAHPLPFLWVIGQRDRLFAAGREYVFERLPAHPASRYLVVDSDHMSTPTDAAAQIAEWVSSLAD